MFVMGVSSFLMCQYRIDGESSTLIESGLSFVSQFSAPCASRVTLAAQFGIRVSVLSCGIWILKASA